MKYTSNYPDVKQKLDDAKNRTLHAIGVFVNGEAVVRAPVDTGLLRSSITHSVETDSVVIGSNVEYAPDVELGTGAKTAQPFLEPAVYDNRSRIEALVRQFYKL